MRDRFLPSFIRLLGQELELPLTRNSQEGVLHLFPYGNGFVRVITFPNRSFAFAFSVVNFVDVKWQAWGWNWFLLARLDDVASVDHFGHDSLKLPELVNEHAISDGWEVGHHLLDVVFQGKLEDHRALGYLDVENTFTKMFQLVLREVHFVVFKLLQFFAA